MREPQKAEVMEGKKFVWEAVRVVVGQVVGVPLPPPPPPPPPLKEGEAEAEGRPEVLPVPLLTEVKVNEVEGVGVLVGAPLVAVEGEEGER